MTEFRIPRAEVALVTFEDFPKKKADDESPMLVDALDRRGIQAEVVPWTAPIDWSSYSLVVLRSAWDANWRMSEFDRWLSEVGAAVPVLNSPEVIRWAIDKHYLNDLRTAGVVTIPTVYIEPGDAIVFPDGEIVIKPAISCGSINTARYEAGGRSGALEHVEALHAENATAMIQPYLSAIDTTGERALVYIEGEFVHAIRKRALLDRGEDMHTIREAHPGRAPYVPSAAEMSLASQALNVVPWGEALLYARVDIVDLPNGEPAVIELELVDPSVFFDVSSECLDRFVSAIQKRLV